MATRPHVAYELDDLEEPGARSYERMVARAECDTIVAPTLTCREEVQRARAERDNDRCHLCGNPSCFEDGRPLRAPRAMSIEEAEAYLERVL